MMMTVLAAMRSAFWHVPMSIQPKAESCPEAAEGRNEIKVLKNKHLGGGDELGVQRICWVLG
jgi:hypothetical protein